MTKHLEKILNIESQESLKMPEEVSQVPTVSVNLQDQLEQFDKISAALPRVKGLGDISDSELDALAAKAEQAYDDLMDLGMNVEARHGARIFEVASNMLASAIQAKSNKIDKKLKMVELQLKKLAIDNRKGNVSDNDDSIVGEAFIVSDRNSMLEKLKAMNKKD